MRKIDLVDLIAGFNQHHALGQGERHEMWLQPIEMISGKRGQQLIIQRKTGV